MLRSLGHVFALLALTLSAGVTAPPVHLMRGAGPGFQLPGGVPVARQSAGPEAGAVGSKDAGVPCGSCPGSIPVSHGGSCLAPCCSAFRATPRVALIGMFTTVAMADFPPRPFAPTANDFAPEPPPPRV